MPQLNNNRAKTSAPVLNPEAAATAELLTRIIALVDEIIAVMDEEIPLVEERRRKEHAELLKRKQRLTLDYRASLKAIVMEPHLLRLVPEELRLKARDAGNRLAEASNRNARTLRAIMTASQRLVQSIIAIIKNDVLPKAGYANTQTGKAMGGYSPTCKPVTVFQTA